MNLGNEPPLSVDGSTGGPIDRRRVSIHWLSGTILTGLCGAALMGGAVFASLDGETNFAAAPERVETALRGALSSLGGRLSGLRKTDRLPELTEAVVSKEILRVPTITRTRNREMVRVRPYTRVFGSLSLTVSELSAKIPAFNPQKLLAAAVVGDDQAAAPQPDAEVSFSSCDLASPSQHTKITPAVCDLGSLLRRVKTSTLLPFDEVLARVRDVARSTGVSLVASAGGALQRSSPSLSYAPAENEPDPYLGFAARIVPENVTLLPKTTTQPNTGSDGSERVITATKGAGIAAILHQLGATPDQIQEIAGVLGALGAEHGLKDGQKVHVLMAPASIGRVLPLRVMIVDEGGIEAAAALSDMGSYVPVDIRNVDTGIAGAGAGKPTPPPAAGSGVTLYQSIYETALRNNVPNSVIQEMVSIYAYDVDFQRKVLPGDTFDVLYAEDSNGDGNYEVRFVSLTAGGETRKFYHFRTADDGTYDYYDNTGKSAKKFLVRKPVALGNETSPFGWRVHPIAHIKEFHSGVDWAAPVGTPIFAAGNGTIEWIGPRGGYGKYVRIRHADGYETAYGHMTAFARGLEVGSRVRQGQVIGFVGSTGVSTGTHVHFEILVNGNFSDPMRVKLPRGRVLDGDTLALFEKDRHELDAQMAIPSRSHLAEVQ